MGRERRRRQHQRAPFVAALVAGLLGLGGGVLGHAAQDTSSSWAPARVPPGATTLTVSAMDARLTRPTANPATALRGAGDANDIATYDKAERSLLEARFARRFVDLRARAAAPSSADSMTRAGYPAGDLDGDGRADVAIDELDSLSRDHTLIATKGTDGSPLWRASLHSYDSFLLPAADLTGDGRADVVTLDLRTDPSPESTCVDNVCVGSRDVAFTWSLSVRSGLDGAVSWHHDYAGHVRQANVFAEVGSAETPVAGTIDDVIVATNALVVPMVADDVTGDNLADVVVMSYDVTGAQAYVRAPAVVDSVAPLLYTNHAEVVRGSDGTTLFTRTTEREMAPASLLPAGNLVGDARPDLVWNELVSTPPALVCASVANAGACNPSGATLHVEALDGTSLTPAWHRSVDVSEAICGTDMRALLADVTGDGRDDLVLSRSACDTITDTAMSGANGGDVWSPQRRERERPRRCRRSRWCARQRPPRAPRRSSGDRNRIFDRAVKRRNRRDDRGGGRAHIRGGARQYGRRVLPQCSRSRW